MNILVKTIFVCMLMATTFAGCPDGCLDCDPSGTICFACGGDLEASVFGFCHENTIDKCNIYGPADECFNCQPTYKFEANECKKDYSGCLVGRPDGTCFECGFSKLLKGTHCSGVINC